MNNADNIFNLELLKVRQERAKKIGFVEYLDNFAINQTSERLREINRKFNNIAIIGGKAKYWAEKLERFDATCIPDNDFLNLNKESCDLIIHALSLHWYDDPVGQLIQVKNALSPDGLMLAFMCGGETLHELRSSFHEAEIITENGVSPRVAPMAELKAVGDLLVRAGFSLCVADKIKIPVSYEKPIELLYDLRGMGETNIMVKRRKSFLNRNTLKKCLEIYSEKHEDDSKHRVKATFELFCLAGWAPAENQQKPIKPGSAKVHFSEVLKN